MAMPFLLLGYAEAKEAEKKRLWLEREKAARSKPKYVIDFEAFQNRWPFVSLEELYYYKRYTDPSFGKPLNAQTLHELRIEHQEVIKRTVFKD